MKSQSQFFPADAFDYDRAKILLTGSLWSRGIMVNLNTAIQADATVDADQKHQWAAIGYHDVVSFTPANAFAYRITQRAWKARFDSNVAAATTFASAIGDPNAGDVTIPGVNLFQCPLWLEAFKAVGRPVVKIAGSTRTSGQHTATFINKSKKVKTYRNAYPGRWAYVTPRDTVFFTYEIVPERGFAAARAVHLNTGVPGSSDWQTGTNVDPFIGTASTAHWLGPISFALARITRVEWLPMQQTAPISYDSNTAPGKVPIGANQDPFVYSMYVKGDDQNMHGAYDMLSQYA